MGKIIGFKHDESSVENVDPRLWDIVQHAIAVMPYDAQIRSGSERGAGDKGNHSKGYAVDVTFFDKDGNAIPDIGRYADSAKIYEQYAQAARVYQQANYPELDETFRWGGGFRQGNEFDFMHLDITPARGGAMAYYDWNTGFNDMAKQALPGLHTVGVSSGLSDSRLRRQIELAHQNVGTVLPPIDIPRRRNVRSVQQQLARHGFDPGPIDGIRGPRTIAAVKEFQRANGLDPDGIVGPLTTAALARSETAPTPMPGRPAGIEGERRPSGSLMGRVLGATAGDLESPASRSATSTLGWKDDDFDPAGSIIRSGGMAGGYLAQLRPEDASGGAADERMGALSRPSVKPPVSVSTPTVNLPRAGEVRTFTVMNGPTTPRPRPPIVAPKPGEVRTFVREVAPSSATQVAPIPMPGRPAALNGSPAPSNQAGPVPAPLPAFRRPVVAAPGAPEAPVAPSGFGNILGGLGGTLGQAGSFLGSTKAQQAANALGTGASAALNNTTAALGETAEAAEQAAAERLLSTVGGRTLLFNKMPGLPPPGSRDPNRYGNTPEERQESEQRRQALIEGKPYVPATSGVRTQLSVPSGGSGGSGGTSTPAPNTGGVQTFQGSSTGRTYEVGKIYQGSLGPMKAMPDGTFKKVG